MEQEDINNRLISLSPIFQRIADPQLALAVDQLLKIIVKQNEIIEAQQQQIIHLQKTIETQQQKIETLEEKLKINSKNSSTPPSGDGFKKEKNKPAKNKKKGKKRKQGGQMGLQLHKGMKSFVWLIFLGMRVYLGTRICYSFSSF